MMLGIIVALLALTAPCGEAFGTSNGWRWQAAPRSVSGLRRATGLRRAPPGVPWRSRWSSAPGGANSMRPQEQQSQPPAGPGAGRQRPQARNEVSGRPPTKPKTGQRLQPAKQTDRWGTIPEFNSQVHTTRSEAEKCLQPFRKLVSSRMDGIGGAAKWDSSQRLQQKFTDAFITPIFRPRNMIGCLVQKAGSSRWLLLFLHAAGYDFGPGGVRAPKAIHTNKLPGSKMDGGETRMYLADPDTPRFIIVRNPYSRFLSAYLDKILANAGSQKYYLSKVRLSREVFGRNLTAKVEDFQDFTAKLYQKVKEVGPSGVPHLGACHINNHFAPQSCLCGIPHGFQYDYVFKLEEQAEWYPGLVKLAGLDHYVKQGWGFNPEEKSADCFWRARGKSCQEMERAMQSPCSASAWSRQHGSRGVRNMSRRARLEAGLGHSTGADAKVQHYYRSPETVRMVAQMFQKDFELFNYETM